MLMNSLKVFTLISLVLLVAAGASAQNGRWVEYSLDGFSSGTVQYARGDGCLAYTRANNQLMLIFDIYVAEWQEIDFGAVQDFEEVETNGNVVFAYTDDLLFGYSAITATWDTMTIEGGYLNVIYHTYGCGKNLAYLITDTYLYVFDVCVGEWQAYDYGLPADFEGAGHRVKDDYVRVVFTRPYPAQAKNVVYSAHTRSFNQLEYGLPLSYQMDHGFAGTFLIGGSGYDWELIGYSALSNTFDVVEYTRGDGEGLLGCTSAGMPTDEVTTVAFSFRGVVPNVSITGNMFGFDTRRGTWTQRTVFFDMDLQSYYQEWRQAGHHCITYSNIYEPDDRYHLFIYSGDDGQIRDYIPEIIWKSGTSGWGTGGNVAGAYDTLTAWGLDVPGDRDSTIDLELDLTYGLSGGDDFFTLRRYSTTADTMFMYFYNGNINSWSHAVVPEHYSTSGEAEAHVYMWRCSGENEIVFYSAYHDEIIERDYPDDIAVRWGVKGPFGYARSESGSTVFVGTTSQAHDHAFNLENVRWSYGSMIFSDASNNLYGYSALSGLCTELATGETPYWVSDSGYVGLVAPSSNSRYYVYNGLADSWTELTPAGTSVTGVVGTKTALVIRSTYVYAFDPEGDPTDVAQIDTDGLLPETVSLSQNYPNPFNPATTIEFDIPRKTDVRIDIFNILGEKVGTPLDKELAAGSYRIDWDGRNDAGTKVATGIYLYRLSANNQVMTKKMLLLK